MMAKSTRWKHVKLGEIAEFRNGVNYNKESFGSGVKVVGVKDFQDYSKPKYDTLEQINPDGVVTSKSILHDGDIIFVRSNGNRELIGRSLFIDRPTEEVTHSAFTIRVRFNSPDIYPKFYSYFFRTSAIRKGLTAYGGGTNISNLNQDILSGLDIPIPDLPTQRKIAGILSAYDNLIENNLRRIKILEQMAQSLYREWFVYVRFPGHESVRFNDSEFGQIPKGWEVKKLKEVCVLTMGQSPKSEYYNDRGEGTPFHQGVTNFGDYFPTDRLYSTEENRIAEEGDILFSVRAPVGRINVANKRIVIGRGVSAIRESNGHQDFLLFQLKHLFQEEDSMGNGAIFKAVTKSDMEDIKLLVPEKLWIERFEKAASPIFTNLKNLTQRNQTLRRTRDLLLPKLLTPVPNNV